MTVIPQVTVRWSAPLTLVGAEKAFSLFEVLRIIFQLYNRAV